MRHLGLAVALASAGCNSLLGIEDLTLADASPPDSAFCYGTLVTRCYDAPPAGALALSSTIDTSTDVRCDAVAQPDGTEVCVVAGATIVVEAAGFTAAGARPLVLLAAETITVTGTLDVASRSATLGAGANPAACGTPGDGATGRHGGGGAGGSFGTRGGIGGVGGGGPGEGGNPGVANAPVDTLTVRGGCPGGAGGQGAAALPGAGGAGGGAVYLIAGTSITVDGAIQASGSGAAATPVNSMSSGGGGGGAGGLVALEAPAIDVIGTVVAHGGGGGEGGGETAGGAPGDNGSVFNAAANGGAGMSEGGDGGRGSVADTAPTSGSPGTQGTGQHGGGGGGGGGAGVVWAKGTLTGTSISPPATIAP